MIEGLVHIVDDEDEVCRSTAYMIGNLGVTCKVWSSGESFLRGADIDGKGCVILDIRMPGMNGFEVLSDLKKYGSSLSVIMVSGHSDDSGRCNAINAGAIDFFEKPYDAGRLLARVEEALSQSTVVAGS